jgi:glycosyltransferase involved in cell wall biosynthesis
MHIAINGWFWDQPNVGSGQYLRNLVRQLAMLRRSEPALQLTLVLPAHQAANSGIPDGVTVMRAGGGRGGGKLGKVWFEQRGFPAAVGKAKADIAHVPYWGPPLASPARLVISVLDVIPLVMPEYAASWGAKLYTSLVTAAARGAAHTITLSEAAKADIVKHIGLPPETITPIYLGVDEAYHPRLGAEKDPAVRRKYNLPDDFVLYLGGFDIRKNVQQLLLAYTYVAGSSSDRYTLVIAGREPAWGSSPVFPDLRRYARELGIEDNIQWIGYVEDDEKPSLYRLARVFVYPSLYEGFGLPVIEAMASGTPTIARDIPVMQEIVGDGAFLVGTDRAMGGAMIALLEQESFRKSLSNQGLAQATRYGWRKTARETFNVYQMVMRR